ncbi:MAG: hypothetical protein E6R07_14190 [Nevskiaceae bacterium]|nr:MAG: hypothetical protein E6R07_14190 [Nevskiaceae bacterium]
MNLDFFIRVDAWLSALVLAFLMILGWMLGSQLRVWRGTPVTPRSTRIEDGGLALFGLLLAFCFSGATSRYEARKGLLLDDSIAIGELATVSAALEEPERSELRNEVVTYVRQRLVFGPMRLDDPRMPQVVAQGTESQARMLTIIRHAIASKNTPSIHTPLLNAYNGLLTAHDKRLYGVRNQVNGGIVVMLVLFGVFTTFTMGRLHDQQGRSITGLLRIGSYVGLVALVFYIIIDLEQPRRGLVLVSQAPMQDLLSSLTGDGRPVIPSASTPEQPTR